VTGAATLASRILGLARDQVLAALFGASDQMDAFVVAFRIPNLARTLFAEGALSSAFIPTFTRHLARNGKEDAWRVGNNVLNLLVATAGALVAAAIVFAPQIVRVFAGDFAHVPGKLELTISLTRVMLPFLVLAAVASAIMGMLNSLHHFFLPALAPAAFNIATIACALFLVPVMPRLGLAPIVAIAVAALLGGLGQIAIQLPSLRREGFRYSPLFNLRDSGVRQVLLLMGPGTIGLAATQVNIFVNTLLATTQGTGAVSWLAYAFRLMYLPIGLFGVSIGTAVLPAVSRHAAADDRDGMRHTLARGLAMMLMVNVPATVGLLVLAPSIVRLLFEHGQFRAVDTVATASAVRLYAVGLVGYSAARITSPAFYAINRSRVPVLVSLGTIALNIVLSLVFVRLFGFAGLALSTSIAAIANAAALLWLLHEHLDGIDAPALTVVLAKVSAAAMVMGAVAAVVDWRFSGGGSGRITAQIASVAASIGAALLVLVVAAKFLRLSEFDEVAALVRARVQKLLGS